MADTTEKKLVIKLEGDPAGAVAAFDKVDRRVDGLDKKIKTFGKISGIGALKGDVSDVAEGLTDSRLGPLGRIAGITGGLMLAVNAVGSLARGFDEVSEKLSTGKIGANEFAHEFVKTIPIIGSVSKALESVGGFVQVLYDTAQGKSTIRQVYEDAKELDEFIKGRVDRREFVFDIIRKGRDAADPAEAIRRQLDIDLDYLRQIREASEMDEDRYQEARRIKTAEAEAKITAIIDGETKKRVRIIESMRGIERDILRIRAGMDADAMEGEGDALGAQIARIETARDAAIADIKRQIAEATVDPTLTDEQRLARGRALADQADTIGAESEARIQRARDEADKRAAQSTFDTIADASEEAMQEASRKADERFQLQRAAVSTWQGERAGLSDARSGTSFFNQSKQSPAEEAAKKTADNTKALAEKFDKAVTLLDKLVQSATQNTTAYLE